MGVVGLAENKANSAQLELEAGAELGNKLGLNWAKFRSNWNLALLFDKLIASN